MGAPSNWQVEIAEYAAARGLRLWPADDGIGIEFTDGYDVFWILPGEVFSTIPVAAAKPVDTSKLIAEFERIDPIRRSVVHAVRHHLASMKIFVDRSQNGHWGLSNESGTSTSTDVGATVTVDAIAGVDVFEIVKKAFEHRILCHHPSAKRIERYLSMKGDPENEKPVPKEPKAQPIFNLHGVLRMMGVCRALDSVTGEQTSEQLIRAATAPGRIAEALLHMADRMPKVDASVSVTNGSLCIKFEDGDAEYVIQTKSRDLAQRVRSLGSHAAGDQLADEYFRLNSARKTVLDAIYRAAADRGWSVQETASFKRVWYFGKNYREVTAYFGDGLTEKLRTLSRDAAIREVLASNPPFAEESVEALRRNGEPFEIDKKELSPHPPTNSPVLRELTPSVIAEMDAFADLAIAEYFQGERTIWDYGKGEASNLQAGTREMMAEWVRLAERHIGGDWPNPNAILILLDAGDARGAELARHYLLTASPDPEVSNAEIELAWRFRHEMPDVARNWLAAQPYESVPYAEKRARLGDPVALRYMMGNGFDVNDETTWKDEINPAIAKAYPSEDVRQVIRQRLLKSARTTWKWSPPNDFDLRVARWLGIKEVADALEENPFMLSGLLTGARRNEMIDEPGILIGGGSFLLAWSKLKPTDFMARLIATIREEDILAEADRIGRESVARNRKNAGALDSVLKSHRVRFNIVKAPMAIAWRRWRARV